MPNCHASCEEYMTFCAERERIREKNIREHEETHLRLTGARKINLEKFRKSRGRG